MALTLDRDTTERLPTSIKEFFAVHWELEVGDLKAMLLLEYILKEIGPTLYNCGVLEAQAQAQEMIGELDGTCHEPEYRFWDG